MSSLEQLYEDIQAEASREEFPIDEAVYKSAGLDPLTPIPFAGNLDSKLGFFARDLGRDEVKARQPLYGAAGRLVRRGVYQTLHGDAEAASAANSETLKEVLEHVILTNTVPYKPPGNKAYAAAVKKRFRPFLERLLVLHWKGDQIITLGNEAFKWFGPYGGRGELTKFFKQPDRYELTIDVTIRATDTDGTEHERQFTLAPLPHPSPLNQTYYARFPEMLLQRLEQLNPFGG